MSAIREYLYEKAQLPEKEWLRREPRSTHPEILTIVRVFEAQGGIYDDLAEQLVHEVAGDLPEHKHHGADDRNPLCVQLGHEVYIARRILDDEQSAAEQMALEAEGFKPLEDARPDYCPLKEGERYIVAFGVTYSGHDVPTYNKPIEGKIMSYGPGLMLIPKGKRTNGYRVTLPMLYKEAATR